MRFPKLHCLGPSVTLVANSMTRWSGSVIGSVRVDHAGAVVSPRSRPQGGCVVSVQPQPWPQVPEATVQAARAAAGKGAYPLAMRARDELGEVFADAEFAEAAEDHGKFRDP